MKFIRVLKAADENLSLEDLDKEIARLSEIRKQKQQQEEQKRRQEEESKQLDRRKQSAKNHLANLIYQVCNGGVAQYCGNGYADELKHDANTFDIPGTLKQMGCPQQGIIAIEKMIEYLQDDPLMVCEECGGEGYISDDETDEEQECPECFGDGYVDAGDWQHCDLEQYGWFDRYDKWLYSLDLDELDNWTDQSHNHSVFMDMMQQNKKNQEMK